MYRMKITFTCRATNTQLRKLGKIQIWSAFPLLSDFDGISMVECIYLLKSLSHLQKYRSDIVTY